MKPKSRRQTAAKNLTASSGGSHSGKNGLDTYNAKVKLYKRSVLFN